LARARTPATPRPAPARGSSRRCAAPIAGAPSHAHAQCAPPTPRRCGSHAALRALLGGSPLALAAALAAIGPPGSPAALAALLRDNHALLREACSSEWQRDAAPLLCAYGESPDALAGMARALAARGIPLARLAFYCHAGAVAALLGAYRRAGRAHEVLAVGDHTALFIAAVSCQYESPEVLRLLLAEYGEPGCATVLAALAACDHRALTTACHSGSARVAALLAAAYGPPGCAALRGARSLPYILKVVFSSLTYYGRQGERAGAGFWIGGAALTCHPRPFGPRHITRARARAPARLPYGSRPRELTPLRRVKDADARRGAPRGRGGGGRSRRRRRCRGAARGSGGAAGRLAARPGGGAGGHRAAGQPAPACGAGSQPPRAAGRGPREGQRRRRLGTGNG